MPLFNDPFHTNIKSFNMTTLPYAGNLSASQEQEDEDDHKHQDDNVQLGVIALLGHLVREAREKMKHK